MNLSPKGANFVRRHEGFVGRWYKDPVGIGTIGIGFTWRSNAFRQWWAKNKPHMEFGPGAAMSREEAEDALVYLFKEEYGKAVNRFLPKDVPQHVWDGTASPVYNLGPGALRWKWAAEVKAGNYAAGAALLRKTGLTAQGVALPGLARRRREEADLIEHGNYADTMGTPVPEDAMADGKLVLGERGPSVAALIRDLASLGYYDGAKDDLFGYGTQAAVLEFQRQKGLKADGYAGPVTLGAISDALKARATPAATQPGKMGMLLAWLLSLFTKGK
jgi:GH24 family phage-related lysozyme (muramidase)